MKNKGLNDEEQEPILSSILSERRKLLGISLEELSLKTGVQTKYLRRMEEGNWNMLPSAVYTRGFLKKYARIVGLNVDDIIERYEQEVDQVREIATGEDKKNKRSSVSNFLPRGGISPKIVKISLVLIVLVFILGYIGWQFSVVLVKPNIVIENPRENEIVVFNDSMVLKGSTDTQSNLFLNDSLMDVSINGNFEKNIELLPGLNVLEFKAVSRFGKETIIIKRIIFEKK